MAGRRRVLIVDDRDENLYALEQSLSHLDVEIVEARSGKAALMISLERHFAVGILDVHMSETDGYELAQTIRQASHPDLVDQAPDGQVRLPTRPSRG